MNKKRKNKRSLLYTEKKNRTEGDFQKISFIIPSSSYLQMRQDMSTDGIKFVSDLMTELVRLYLEKDSSMLQCVDQIKDVITYQSKTKKKYLSGEMMKGREFLRKFDILNETERQDIFDIIEGEVNEDEIFKV